MIRVDTIKAISKMENKHAYIKLAWRSKVLNHHNEVQGYSSIRIDVYDGWFSFTNPGKMLISTQQFFLGGDSRPRNEIIMKLFRLLGVSERQGFGGPLIYKMAMQNDYKRPEILTNIERTELKVWNIDLVDSYPDLASDEKSVLRYIVKSSQAQSVNSIRNALNMTEYRVRNSIKTLEDEELIRKIGNGPSTKYTIGIESVEFITQIQMAMDILKKQMS